MQMVKAVKDRKDVPFKYLIRYARKSYKNKRTEIEIIEVRNGIGVHVHDSDCNFSLGRDLRPCRRDIGDSDWEVEISYACHWDFHKGANRQYCSPDRRHRAVYGVLDGKFSLWMD